MNSARLLSVLGADPEKWAAKFGLEPFSAPCSECGSILTTTIPCARGQLRGLRAPTCECGNKRTPYCLVRDSRFGDLLEASEL